MKFIIFQVLLFLLSSHLTLKNVLGEQQRVTRDPVYNKAEGVHRYKCYFHSLGHCLWLKNNKTFIPTQHGYKYEDYKTKCTIKAVSNSIDFLRDTSCVGYINYTTTIIYAAVNENVNLNCQSTLITNCGWRRNDAIVSMGGRYAYASNLTKSKNCSIRIYNVSRIDYGKWTCSEQSTDNKNTEIIASLVLKASENYNEVSSQSGDQNDSSVHTTGGRSKTTDINILSTETITDISASSTSAEDENSTPEVQSVNKKQVAFLVGLSVVGAVAIILLICVIVLCKRSKQRKRNSALPNINLREIDASNNPEVPEEAIYANVSSHHVTASEVGDISMETDPEVNITYPDNKSQDETEVVYTQVIVTKKASASSASEVPHYDINQVTYASVKRRRFSQDLSK